MTIRLLLVDDQNLVRQGIESLLKLSEHIDVIAQLEDGDQVERAIHVHKPDIILLDIRMPIMSGTEVLALMKEKELTTPVLVLTTFDEHELVLECMQLGAKGYLKKDVSLASLIAAIETVAKGERWVQPAITSKIAAKSHKTNLHIDIKIEELTAGEKQVLQLVAAGYSNHEIALALHKSPGTIRNTVSFILAKLQVRDRTRAVLKAIEHGIIG